LSFGALGYNLRDDEIILIQSLLEKEYFEGLVPAVINKYVKNNNYDDVEPLESQVYDNNIKLNNQLANIQGHGEQYMPKLSGILSQLNGIKIREL
jgi:hypothetical protein